MPLSISGDGTITGLSAGGLPNGSVTADDLASTLDLSGKTVTGLTNDSITEGNTTAEVVDTGSDGHFKVTTEGTERLRVDSSGRLGIGTASPTESLQVFNGNILLSNGYDIKSPDNFAIYDTTNSIDRFTYSGSNVYNTPSGGAHLFRINSSEKARIDSSGRMLMGTSTARNNFFNSSSYAPTLQIETTSAITASLSVVCSEANNDGGRIILAHQRSGGIGGNTILNNGDEIGRIAFQGSDGSELVSAAQIVSLMDGTPGANDMPGMLIFGTTADGASSPVERLRISNDGAFRGATGIYGDYSGASANLSIDSTGHITRGSSSIRYKTQVETLEDQYADALLQCRPVWYRSTSKNDNPDWSFYGLIAEEVAEIDPRLVQWRTTNPVVQEDGTMEHVPCDPVPEGISYDRFVPHLLNLIKRQKEQIETLESRVAQLEGGAA